MPTLAPFFHTNKSADKVRPSKTKKANQYVKSLLIQCAWAATKTRGTRLSLWYWRNMPRLGDKKAITAIARKLLCYIYAMLESGTFYDKSLDVAYAEQIGAQKLDAARKIVGSRTNVVPSSDRCGNNDVANVAKPSQDLDGTHKESKLAMKPADVGKHSENGIQSPVEATISKKRGRPKKSVAP